MMPSDQSAMKNAPKVILSVMSSELKSRPQSVTSVCATKSGEGTR